MWEYYIPYMFNAYLTIAILAFVVIVVDVVMNGENAVNVELKPFWAHEPYQPVGLMKVLIIALMCSGWIIVLILYLFGSFTFEEEEIEED